MYFQHYITNNRFIKIYLRNINIHRYKRKVPSKMSNTSYCNQKKMFKKIKSPEKRLSFGRNVRISFVVLYIKKTVEI